ncbi:hypothetical protein F5884DRAFT_777624 [Xylogone sp. PMI_703]|nr:hypothetical protein F5884DRAFT_777624 [Xylogone sp. PMI_703]
MIFGVHFLIASLYRTVTIIVALATLTSNGLSALLFHQLPDDPYHLSRAFSWYLHFANLLSVFGFIGAVRKHALSIAIFANYLVLDTILCCVPRFLLLGLLKDYSSQFCTDASFSSAQIAMARVDTQSLAVNGVASLEVLAHGWSPQGCLRIVRLAQLTLAAGVVAATLMQFVGALYVRDYAKCLWLREVSDDIVLMIEEFGDDEEVRSQSLWRREVSEASDGKSLTVDYDNDRRFRDEKASF